MLSAVMKFTKILAIEISVGLLVLFAFVGITPAYAAEATAFTDDTGAAAVVSDVAADVETTEVLPVYQGASSAETTPEVLPVYLGAADDKAAFEATNATGVQPMGVEGAPLLHALDEFGGWAIPLAAVGVAMLMALGIFGIQMMRARKHVN